jgi:hypothetical protein
MGPIFLEVVEPPQRSKVLEKGQMPWLMAVFLATWKAEIRRISLRPAWAKS